MWTDWIRWINIATNECLCWRECKNFNLWSLLKIERGREKKDQTIDTCRFEVNFIMLDTRSVTVACPMKRERAKHRPCSILIIVFRSLHANNCLSPYRSQSPSTLFVWARQRGRRRDKSIMWLKYFRKFSSGWVEMRVFFVDHIPTKKVFFSFLLCMYK